MTGLIPSKWCPWIIAMLGLVQDLQLTEGKEARGNPLNFPPRHVPTNMKFCFFNVTNPQGFADGNGSLNLVEIGPYMFREVIEMNGPEIFENGTVEYYEKKTFSFVREESVGDQSELMTTINAPVLSSIGEFLASTLAVT
ncbi:unnamed protein product [Darwinula stevensoni]|uniref:Scavenger receptor class B member 1 n=1 Tax=Darwinula stevensoni TaxID=69355 RepID=A0A7R9AF99_9CRUS|nr:unnamed protein product [Darwinula stevensoni]CAG0903099.1 unnamed protein product [Darwinula stevensoni]